MSLLNSSLDIQNPPNTQWLGDLKPLKSLLRRSVAGSNASWKDVWISRGCDHSHRIRVWFICTYIYHKIQLNVGRYTSPMDAMGSTGSLVGENSTSQNSAKLWGSFARSRQRSLLAVGPGNLGPWKAMNQLAQMRKKNGLFAYMNCEKWQHSQGKCWYIFRTWSIWVGGGFKH